MAYSMPQRVTFAHHHCPFNNFCTSVRRKKSSIRIKSRLHKKTSEINAFTTYRFPDYRRLPGFDADDWLVHAKEGKQGQGKLPDGRKEVAVVSFGHERRIGYVRYQRNNVDGVVMFCLWLLKHLDTLAVARF
jgi:hypothetical protein